MSCLNNSDIISIQVQYWLHHTYKMAKPIAKNALKEYCKMNTRLASKDLEKGEIYYHLEQYLCNRGNNSQMHSNEHIFKAQ